MRRRTLSEFVPHIPSATRHLSPATCRPAAAPGRGRIERRSGTSGWSGWCSDEVFQVSSVARVMLFRCRRRQWRCVAVGESSSSCCEAAGIGCPSAPHAVRQPPRSARVQVMQRGRAVRLLVSRCPARCSPRRVPPRSSAAVRASRTSPRSRHEVRV